MKIINVTAISLTALILCTSASAAIIRVDVDRPGGGDGTSWSSAYNSLVTALGSSSAGDEIWVAQGTYIPSSTGDRTVSFNIARHREVRGGYAGYGEANPDARDFRNFPTILSGDLGSVNSYHVIVTGNSGPSNEYAKVDGFRITAGVADGGSTNNHDRGAGVLVLGQTKLIDCLFIDNEADAAGGAIDTRSIAEIINCIFINNRAGVDGGAICVDNVAAPYSVKIVNCVFNNNFADEHGGALHALSDASAYVYGCTFVHNETGGAGSAVFGDDDEQNSQTSNSTVDCSDKILVDAEIRH